MSALLIISGITLTFALLQLPRFLTSDDQDRSRREILLSSNSEDSEAASRTNGSIGRQNERVLILGASSGCGEELAYRYVKRGAKVCLVARRQAALTTVANNCLRLLGSQYDASEQSTVLSFVGDVSSPEDMVRVREEVVEAWNGLDTLHIISGVTSTEPLLQGAGVERVKLNISSSTRESRPRFTVSSANPISSAQSDSRKGDVSDAEEVRGGGNVAFPSVEGLKSVLEDARRCAEVNVYGMVNVTACFLPLLASTSASPLIHHLSSVAALIPAPTRSLYAATKAGGLAMFRSVAAEVGGVNGLGVRFLAICPGTIDTDFRRNSLSSKRGVVSSEGFDRKTLTVDQTIDSILYHCDLPPRSIPLGFTWFGFAVRLPFVRVAPSDIVFLPEMPYRVGYWLLDTPLRSLIAKMGRKKYQLE